MNWTLESLLLMITDEVEESLSLDYKAAAALYKSDGKKKSEITKDVSSFANSAGGTIIYGMKEYDQPDKKHRPEKLDPVDRSHYSKEWLEHVINNIRPRIDNVTIHPVPIGNKATEVVYVVEIPQSTTAHQAVDLRYYKRFNFESVPMYDHEIRDVMARSQHPLITLCFDIVAKTQRYTNAFGISLPVLGPPSFHDTFDLNIWARNVGNKYAQFVNAVLLIPLNILIAEDTSSKKQVEKDGTIYVEISVDNIHRDVVDMHMGYPKYGPGHHVPILPRLSRKLDDISLTEDFTNIELGDLSIEWSVYADNAPPVSDKVAIRDIPIEDRRPGPAMNDE